MGEFWHGTGLTREERPTLKACPRTTLVTIPGTSYFIPTEESERVASLLVDALDQAVDQPIGRAADLRAGRRTHPAAAAVSMAWGMTAFSPA
jgi:hypothetical protein